MTKTEAVAIFDDVARLDEAVEALIKAGFHKDDISLLASEAAVEEKLGHRYQRVEELEDDPKAPRVVYRTLSDIADDERSIATSLTLLPAVIAAGTVVASAGVVAAVITGAALSGAVLSTVLARWLDKSHADHLQEQLERGGLLVWVTLSTPERRDTALRILMEHATSDVHVHEFTPSTPDAE